MAQDGKPLKILMTADTIGGVWTYSLELLAALGAENIEVALATMGAPLSVFQQEQVKELPFVQVYESNFKLEWMENPWTDVEAAGQWLLDIKNEFNPDVIHLNNFPHGNLNWGKPVVMVVHSCVKSWWQAVKNEPAPESWNTYQEKVGEGLRAADLVVAPSKAMLAEAVALYGPFKKQRVIYNGRNTDNFRYGKKEPFVFSMGRIWDEAKNIQALAEVAASLSWPVYVAGETAHPDSGKDLPFRNIRFLGKLNEVEIKEYLSRASIFALPAKYEPFGLSALEAANSGCALVLGKIPSQQEIWEQAATYVNPNNPDELKTSLNNLIEDEFIRNIMSFRAIQRGLKYSGKQKAFEYYRVYHQLISERE
ncbi:glycosyltransferase [Adhaeribacter aquaticus]|uniref:glycosyltransferase n=1 Tax=Adhaeribacter aquaticus TaxID=299567 RepID=UPI00041E898B|nr:glycosyltransferase [Adhaeribacter aquaticus]